MDQLLNPVNIIGKNKAGRPALFDKWFPKNEKPLFLNCKIR